MKLKDVFRAYNSLPVRDRSALLFGASLRRRHRVYGWHIDPAVSDPARAVTYIGSAAGMTPAAMHSDGFSFGSWENAFFMPRPCMLRYDGTVAYYLDPDDYSKKADGSASDIADPSFPANAMMEWPLIWYKFEAGEREGEGYFFCSDSRVDESYHCWCNYDARDNIIPHFYTSIYSQNVIDGRLRSLSGRTTNSENGGSNMSGQSEAAAAMANNTTDTVEWYTDVWADRCLINALLILMGRSTDLQGVFGYGLVSGDVAASEAYVTGSLDRGGLFAGSTDVMTQAVKVFGMENWWGHKWHRVAGMQGTPGVYPYKLTWGTADGSTWVGYQEPLSNGYAPVRTPDGQPAARPTGTGYISKCLFGAHGFVPITLVGSPDTAYRAECYTAEDNAYCLVVGGDSNSGTRAGLTFAVNNSFVSAYKHIATGLSCKPLS